MTPYRSAPDRVRTHWVSQPFRTVMFGAMAVGLCAIGVVLVVADSSSLIVPTLSAAALCGLLFQAGLVRLVVDQDRVRLVRGILWQRAAKSISLRDGARVQVTHRNRPYRAHVVEIVNERGFSVLAECDDHAEALEISRFVEQAQA